MSLHDSTLIEELSSKLLSLQGEIDHTSKMLIRRDIELMSANEELQELDRAKSGFVSTAAHQLRTPLTSINWFTEILLTDENLTKEQRSQIENIHTSGQRMAKLITALLNTSRLELGTQKIVHTTFNPIQLLSTIKGDLTGLLDEKNITYITKLENAPSLIKTDKHLLEMILHNLISNAIKYTPSLGTITISLYSRDDTITYIVEDTGYGIPEEEQKKVFQKFYRASNILDGNDGTGLGLHIVSMSLKKLNGSLSLASEVNKGTTFTISFPSENVLEQN